jgi:hypothetical protein
MRPGTKFIDAFAGTIIEDAVRCECGAEEVVPSDLSQPDARRSIEAKGWRCTKVGWRCANCAPRFMAN